MLGLVAMLGMGTYIALYLAIWAVLVFKIGKPPQATFQHGSSWAASLTSLRSAFFVAASWVALEWVRSWLFTGFGWNSLGVGLVYHAALIQVADIVGTPGLAFTPLFLGTIFLNTVKRIWVQKKAGHTLRWHFDTTVGIIVVAAQMLYGMKQLAYEPKDVQQLRVALVQLNIPQAERWAADGDKVQEYYQRLEKLTRLYITPTGVDQRSGVDLVVWPESSLVQLYAPGHADFFNPLLQISDFSLISGTDVQEPAGKAYVSAVLLHREWQDYQLYHKRHLVPFGEFLPLRWVPGMVTLFGNLFPGDFQHAGEQPPLALKNLPGVEILPLICFEDTIPRKARNGVRNTTQLLVNITNDGWFLQSCEPQTHLINAMLRCVELRRPMVRACNTGVSCIIDANGRELKRLQDETGSCMIEGVLPGTVTLEKSGRVSFYAQYGDVFSMFMAACTVLGLWYKR
jgi:apolipoprotein N-acyltransferase